MWSDWGLDRSPLGGPVFRRQRAPGTGNSVHRAVGAPRELRLHPHPLGTKGSWGRWLLSLSRKKKCDSAFPTLEGAYGHTSSPPESLELGLSHPDPGMRGHGRWELSWNLGHQRADRPCGGSGGAPDRDKSDPHGSQMRRTLRGPKGAFGDRTEKS